ATSRPRLKRLKVERKPGASEEKTIQKPTTMVRSPSCAEAPARLRRRGGGASLRASAVMAGVIVGRAKQGVPTRLRRPRGKRLGKAPGRLCPPYDVICRSSICL